VIREGRFLLVCKALIAAFGVGLFLLPLATPPGLIAGTAGTLGGYLFARAAGRLGLRLPVGLAAAGLLILAAHLGGQLVLDGRIAGRRPPPSPSPTCSSSAPAASASSSASGSCRSGARLLGARAGDGGRRRRPHLRRSPPPAHPPAALLQRLGLVAGHRPVDGPRGRRRRRHRPRRRAALADALEAEAPAHAAGAPDLRPARLLSSCARCIIGGKPDTNELGLSKDEKDKQDKGGGGSSGGSSRKPDPVAVALLHDELPDADIIYFRQTVLSRFLVDRLVGDTSGQFDSDVISTFPSGSRSFAETTQSPAFHREVLTSMYLLVDHAQPSGWATRSR
jgi:hypothetical protein